MVYRLGAAECTDETERGGASRCSNMTSDGLEAVHAGYETFTCACVMSLCCDWLTACGCFR